MVKKGLIRKQYLLKRSKKYLNIKKSFFHPLVQLLKKNLKKKKIKIALYFPTKNELNVIKIFEVNYFNKCKFLYPVVEENGSMNFYEWKKYDVLNLNKYGITEPLKTINPDVILVPLLAYDKFKHRLGYGGGYYDRYFSKLTKLKKLFLTVGVAFSFQKYNKLPFNNKDFKLKYILTEKGLIK